MRLPFEADGPENKPETPPSARETQDNRDPSYPDRARIDSDVRAFLRPVSSPWIVFDRDSRVEGDFAKSALRIGAIFASSPSLLPEPRDIHAAMASSEMKAAETRPQPMFPQAALQEAPVTEPSNVVVAKDVEAAELAALASAHDRSDSQDDEDQIPPGLVPNRKRPLMIAGTIAGVVGVLSIAALVLISVGGRRHIIERSAPANALVQPPARAAEPSPRLGDPPVVPSPEPAATIEIDPQPPAPVAPVAAKAEARIDEGENAKDPKKRFGKLTIKGDAAKAGKLVWFDGKRMIGIGPRNYLVFCGMHTVAVSDKTDTKDVEVPCNGELVISR